MLERGSAAAPPARPLPEGPPPPLSASTVRAGSARRLAPAPSAPGLAAVGEEGAARERASTWTTTPPPPWPLRRPRPCGMPCSRPGATPAAPTLQANNMVIHTACRHFRESQARPGNGRGTPHIVTSSVEHDSIRLPLEQLVKESLAEATFVAVSPQSGRAEVDDVLAAIRPTTCLVSIMLANNETGVIMPVTELSQRVHALNQWRVAEGLPRILVHTDAAQMIGKGRVDVQELGVDYLTIVGHKFYGPRIGALYVRGPGTTTPLHPMLFGGGQERSFRPGTENTPMIAGLGRAAELVSKNWEAYKAHMQDVRDYLEARLEASFGKQRIHLNSHFMGSKRLCNTSNFSILGPGLQGRRVLSCCKTLLASVGAACHSEKGDRPSAILLSCGIPYDVAQNALRLSVGRDTTRADVDLVVQDLVQAVAQLDQDQAP
ncbi:selenocysteine lyase isoform X3 [Aquila chrysaetos chrysaetos]|uniref:selenocysteine lyase isoform X3 n=1 Tax=Aquila chrysaetos chrysaetos TaxID=223781 RepID=UPI001176CD05|nr:selenocysteine lyase isoform X3 [Aquila chrysaetos chrysaetos]